MAPPSQCRVVLRAGRGCPERAVRGKDLRVGVDGNNALKGREALITLTGADGTVKTVTVTQGPRKNSRPSSSRSGSGRRRMRRNCRRMWCWRSVTALFPAGLHSWWRTRCSSPSRIRRRGGFIWGSQEIASGETEVDFSGPVVLTVRNKGGGERGIQGQPGQLHGAARGL